MKKLRIWISELIRPKPVLRIMLDAGAIMPERAHENDAGLDLFSRETCYVFAGDQHEFDTGVHVEIPKGYVGLITSKSKPMRLGVTSRGTIDSGYTGSIRAVLYNNSKRSYLVERGKKITQLVILPILTPKIQVVKKLDSTERGDGGFGSTGE